MGKEKRAWRKLVKKLRRKRKRQCIANSNLKSLVESQDVSQQELENYETDEEDKVKEEYIDPTFFLRREEWEYREEQTKLENALKRAERERREEIEAEKQKKIRQEWEAKLERERKLKEEHDRLAKLEKEKQDIETPPVRYLMPEVTSIIDENAEVCFYFSKTAACKFGARCTKLHPRPTLSSAILIPNFFSHFKLEQSVRDEYDTDLGLEYEDKELYKEFLEFYDDVVPELRKFGTLVQFKVCCNLEAHLSGNVYVQYQTIQEAVEAFRSLNGRFYNGKQLSLIFIKMDSWRSAICGSFQRKACVKGRTCNFLHVFRNPTKEFVKADHDWKDNRSSLQQEVNKNFTKSLSYSTPASNSQTPSSTVMSRSDKLDLNGKDPTSRRNKTIQHQDRPNLVFRKSHSKQHKSRSHHLSPKHKKRKKEKKKKKTKKHKKSHRSKAD